MSLTYTTYVQRVMDQAASLQTDMNFVAVIPGMIDYAEQRIYRELDLLSTVTRQTGTLTIGTRTFNLPSSAGRFVVTNGINVITPSSQVTPDNGTRVPLSPVSRDVLDVMWPSTTGAGVPSVYAMITDQQIIVGPSPAAAYTVEVIGTIRPTPLSTSNTTTYLTLYLPDLFVAASMIYLADGARRNGNPVDVTKLGADYDRLVASAGVEEQRKRYASGAWGSLSPTPIATASR